MSTKIIPGEECVMDLSKCFEFTKTGPFNMERTIGRHTDIFGRDYYNKYATVKEGVDVKAYKDTGSLTRTHLLLPSGTHVHLRDETSDSYGLHGRADYAIVEKIETLEGKEIDSVPSRYDKNFVYSKDDDATVFDFYGLGCFSNPSFSILKGLGLGMFHWDCSNHPSHTTSKPGIHFVLEKKNLIHR